jgi:hypothetical protein
MVLGISFLKAFKKLYQNVKARSRCSVFGKVFFKSLYIITNVSKSIT